MTEEEIKLECARILMQAKGEATADRAKDLANKLLDVLQTDSKDFPTLFTALGLFFASVSVAATEAGLPKGAMYEIIFVVAQRAEWMIKSQLDQPSTDS